MGWGRGYLPKVIIWIAQPVGKVKVHTLDLLDPIVESRRGNISSESPTLSANRVTCLVVVDVKD